PVCVLGGLRELLRSCEVDLTKPEMPRGQPGESPGQRQQVGAWDAFNVRIAFGDAEARELPLLDCVRESYFVVEASQRRATDQTDPVGAVHTRADRGPLLLLGNAQPDAEPTKHAGKLPHQPLGRGTDLNATHPREYRPLCTEVLLEEKPD